ncbi:hypothetical protein [Aureispira anguillae]|uniref:Uncharacterized protein n=1 Tax=Aureispira anguillae TaxID=2864201 RepID=A0A916DVW7_9BACT|nr:hypothetical protein [Aureispira anguillae]BDS13496.1 hypothetical protein AsAng_0042340 [Aureispira anguillae]
MKDNYNIKVNPPELSSEQIEKHQDFDALFAQFQAKVPPNEEMAIVPASETTTQTTKGSKISPLMIKYGTGAVMAVAASILLVFMIRQSMMSLDATIPTSQINEQLALQAPFSDFSKPFSHLVVNSAEEGETLNYHSGSKIIVPASAFVDEKGLPVKGKVDIQYREFNDHVDMFLAGVPKEQDKHQNLQSAGMMEIKGFKDGKPVYLSMDKTLDVELKGKLAQEISTTDLKVYVYSKQDDLWDYTGKDDVEVITQVSIPQSTPEPDLPTKEEALAQAKVTLASSKPRKPIRPGQPNDMQSFDLDINIEDFPELAAYNQDVTLMVKKSALTNATFDTVWNSMKMVGLGNNKYQMELVYEGFEGNIVRKFEVYPVVVATQEAQKRYEAEMDDYHLKLEQWEQDVIAEAEQVANPQTIANNERMWNEVVNRFSIHRFGLWNCGKEVILKETLEIKASFVDENGNDIDINQLFITNNDQQLYYFASTTTQDNETSLKYDATAENKIWALTAENELLVANVEDEERPNNEFVFQMKPAGRIDSEEDVRTLLTF